MSKLLEMTHHQWIYRCITKHHKTKGTKVLAVQEDLMTEIERLLDTGAEGVAQEDRWMLDIDQDQLMSYSVEDKQFWINSVNAAMKACANALEKSDGASNSWSEVVRDGKFWTKQPSQDAVSQQEEEAEGEKVAEEAHQPAAQPEQAKRQTKKQRKEEEGEAKEEEDTARHPVEPSAKRRRKHEVLDRHPIQRKAKMARASHTKKISAKPRKNKEPSNPPQTSRAQHISANAAEADSQHLGLFTKVVTLTKNGKRNIKEAFDAPPIDE